MKAAAVTHPVDRRGFSGWAKARGRHTTNTQVETPGIGWSASGLGWPSSTGSQYFAGPTSDYVTGQILSVSGGLTMAG